MTRSFPNSLMSPVIWIGFVATGVRLLWIFAVHNNPLIAEGLWYDARAMSMLRGEGFSYQGMPTAFLPVGYPLLLTLVYRLCGHWVLGAQLANVALSVTTCFLIVQIGSRVFERRVGLCAGWLFALYPNQITYNSVLMSDLAFTTIFTGVIAFVVLRPGPEESMDWRQNLLLGLLIGVAALVRPVGLILPVCLWLYWAFGLRLAIGQVNRAILPVLFGIAVVVTPWFVRNLRVMHAPILVSTNGGVNFRMAQLYGTFMMPPPALTGNWMHPIASREEEVAAEHQAYHDGFLALRQHPARPVIRWPHQMIRFFDTDVEGLTLNAGNFNTHSVADYLPNAYRLSIRTGARLKIGLFVLSEFYYLVLLSTAAAGCWQMRRRLPPKASLLLILIGVWVLVHTLIFFPTERFRMPLMPLMIIFSAVAIAPRLKRNSLTFAPSSSRPSDAVPVRNP